MSADYTTANNPELPTLNETQRAALYSELASGAETGWDYSARWMADPTLTGDAGLRTLQVKNIIPVCLNSILCKPPHLRPTTLVTLIRPRADNAHTLLARLYSQHGTLAPSGTNATQSAAGHSTYASALRAGILDLLWDGTKASFYDYHISQRARSPLFSAAAFYPLWAGIIPPAVLSNQIPAFDLFASLHLVLTRYNGTFPSTFLTTGQQWDAPNAWPPHQFIAIAALEALPANLTAGALPTPPAGQSTFALVPAGQLGLDEDALPRQPLSASANASASGAGADINALNGTVVNGGNATDGEGWAAVLRRELANRYIASALCSWCVLSYSASAVMGSC